MRRPLWIWPFITGIAIAVAVIAVAVRVETITTTTTSFHSAIGDVTASPASQCDTDRQTLEVAVEAWYAIYPSNGDPSQEDLIHRELLRGPIDSFELLPTGGNVDITPTDGGGCD